MRQAVIKLALCWPKLEVVYFNINPKLCSKNTITYVQRFCCYCLASTRSRWHSAGVHTTLPNLTIYLWLFSSAVDINVGCLLAVGRLIEDFVLQPFSFFLFHRDPALYQLKSIVQFLCVGAYLRCDCISLVFSWRSLFVWADRSLRQEECLWPSCLLLENKFVWRYPCGVIDRCVTNKHHRTHRPWPTSGFLSHIALGPVV